MFLNEMHFKKQPLPHSQTHTKKTYNSVHGLFLLVYLGRILLSG